MSPQLVNQRALKDLSPNAVSQRNRSEFMDNEDSYAGKEVDVTEQLKKISQEIDMDWL